MRETPAAMLFGSAGSNSVPTLSPATTARRNGKSLAATGSSAIK